MAAPRLVVSGNRIGPAMPATVKIGPFAYSLTVKPSNLMSGASGAYSGLHSSRYTHIALDVDQTPERMKDVSLHEVVHGILDNAGLDVRAQKDSNTLRFTEEEFIAALSPGLLGVLRDNPAYLAWLLDSTTD